MFGSMIKTFGGSPNIAVMLSVRSEEGKTYEKFIEIKIVEAKERESQASIEGDSGSIISSENVDQSLQIRAKIEFKVPDWFFSPTSFKVGATNISQPYSDKLHAQSLKFFKKEPNSSNYGYLLCDRFVDPKTFTVERITLYGQNILPEGDWTFVHDQHQPTSFRSVVSDPHPNFITLMCLAESNSNKDRLLFCFVNDLEKNQFLAWRTKLAKKKKKLTFLKVEKNQDHLIILEQTREFKRVIAECVECKAFNLKTRSTLKGGIWINKNREKRLFKFVGLIQEDLQNSVSQRFFTTSRTKRKPKLPKSEIKLILSKRNLYNRLNHSVDEKSLEFSYSVMIQKKGRKFKNNFLNEIKILEGIGNANILLIESRMLQAELFVFILDIEQKLVHVKQFKEGDIEQSRGEWRIGLHNLGASGHVLGDCKEFLNNRDKFFRVLNFGYNEKEEDNQNKSLHGVLSLSWVSMTNDYNSPKPGFITNVNFTLENKVEQNGDNQDSNPVILGDIDNWRVPYITQIKINRALCNMESPVVEIMEGVYINLKKNKIYERNFKLELQRLWKDLKNVSQDDIVDILMRLISLGEDYQDLVGMLKIEEILGDLKRIDGWDEGENYFKLVFGKNNL